MISDDELAKELFETYKCIGSFWLEVARRARALLLPPEAEAVLKAAEQQETDHRHYAGRSVSVTADKERQFPSRKSSSPFSRQRQS